MQRAAELDPIDRRILEELQRDAGLTNQELAARVGLSPSPCLRRVKALEIVEDTGKVRRGLAHRPGRLFRFASRRTVDIRVLT